MLSAAPAPAAAESLARAIAGIGGPVGVTVDGRAATASPALCPAFRYRLAPAGLATRRQLSACGLRPGGRPPVATVSWWGGRRWAALYEVATALPKRAMTPAKQTALRKAMRARRTCPNCQVEGDYVISTRLGACVDCVYGPADVDTAADLARWAA